MAVITKRLNWLKWLYPGEGGLQSDQDWHIDKRRNHMKDDHVPGVVSGLEVLETSPTPDLFVHVQIGRGVGGGGEEIVLESIEDVDLTSYASGGATVKIVAEYAEQGTDPYIVPETSTSQDKFLQDDPTITVITGAPAANQIVLAQVVVSNGATQITDAADPENPGTNEIDLRYRTPNYAIDLRMVTDKSVDADISTVTVGEFGCDFNDIGRALAFVNGLVRSDSRQIEVMVFGKRDGASWGISVAITVPSWTHLVGVGKPTLETTVTAGTVITLSEGSSLKNFCIETSVTGWAYQISSNAADDVTIRNVDVRYEYTFGSTAGYAIGIQSGNRIRIENFRLFPNAATPTNGCRGIWLAQNASVNDITLTNLYLEGDQLLLNGQQASITQLRATNIVLIGTTATGTNALGALLGTKLSDSSFVNVYGKCVAGSAEGLQVGGVGVTLSNIVLECAIADNIELLHLDSDATLQGFSLLNGVLYLATRAVASNGSVVKGGTPGAPVALLETEAAISNVFIDRDNVNGSGIGPVGGASNCRVTNCKVYRTGTEPSIKGGSGANYWLVQGCLTENSPDPNGGVGWMIACEEGDVYKSVDEPTVSDVSLNDDSELKFWMKAGKKYDFAFVVFCSSAAVGGILLSLNGPGGVQNVRFHIEFLVGGDPTHANSRFGLHNAYDALTGNNVAFSGVAYLRGSVENGTTAGALVLRWAQSQSDVTPTIVAEGSHLKFREVQ